VKNENKYRHILLKVKKD